MHLVWAWNPRAKKCFSRTRKGRGRTRTRLQAVSYNRQSDREGQQGMDTLRKGAHALTTAHRASLRSSPGLCTWCGLGTQEPISVFPEPGKGGSDTPHPQTVTWFHLQAPRLSYALRSSPGLCTWCGLGTQEPGVFCWSHHKEQDPGYNRGLRVSPTTRLQGAQRYPPQHEVAGGR